MTKQVLDVGQCTPDHLMLSRLIENRFDASVSQASSQQQAIEMASKKSYDLILINRIMDADGSEGLSLLKELKSDPRTQAIPAMLVSNYHDAQMQAIEQGALPGFGKANLNSQATLDQLSRVLT